ncbi:MAG: HNH endonuclease [Dysgonomonas sp.]
MSIATMISEEWKYIIGYEDKYMISNTGEVLSVQREVKCKSGVIKNFGGYKIKAFASNKGYMQVSLSGKTLLLHRLIAEAFIPNPENKPQINHINGNKSDNRIENLEWATQSENISHAYKNGYKTAPFLNCRAEKNHLSKAVTQYKNGVKINDFGSIREASRITGVNSITISRVCKGAAGHAGGYMWKFKQ